MIKSILIMMWAFVSLSMLLFVFIMRHRNISNGSYRKLLNSTLSHLNGYYTKESS